MEKVSEILNSIKERLSNPLIFSFIISWLVYNWRIPVALLWFDEKQISANGCNSIFEFITDDWNKNGYFWIPVVVAFAYTIFLPIFKGLYRLLNSVIFKYADKWDLKILQNGSVSMEKYLKFRESYLKRTKELDKIIKDEEKHLEENNKIREELNIASENAKNSFQNNMELNRIINEMDDNSIFNGYWKCTYTINGDFLKEEDAQIRYGKYEVILNENKIEHQFDLFNFHINSRKKTVFFIKKMTNKRINDLENMELTENDVQKINVLRIENENLYTGTENQYVSVRYERVSDLSFERERYKDGLA